MSRPQFLSAYYSSIEASASYVALKHLEDHDLLYTQKICDTDTIHLGGGLFNHFDGSVDLLDDLDDHYTARTHKKERNWMVEKFQEICKQCKSPAIIPFQAVAAGLRLLVLLPLLLLQCSLVVPS